MLTQESNAKAIKEKEQYLTGISTAINRIISKETNPDIVAKLDKVQSAIPETLRVQPTWLQVISRAILFVFNKLMGASPKSNASEQDPLTKNFSTNTKGVDKQNVESLKQHQSTSCKAQSITTLRQGEDNGSKKKPKCGG